MDKNILIILAGQLRAYYEAKPSIQRLIDFHSTEYSVDVLFLFPEQSRIYYVNDELKYDYTGVDFSQELLNCKTHVREVDETMVETFCKRNGFNDHFWLPENKQKYPSYLPVLNFWFYRALAAVEKTKIELSENKTFNTVLMSRAEHAFVLDVQEPSIPNLPPGLILDRKEDIDRFSPMQFEKKFFGKVETGSFSRFRNDVIQQMSSSTFDLYNMALFSLFNSCINPSTFGSMTHHQQPELLPNTSFFVYDAHTKNNSLISQAVNDSLTRGNTIDLNYIAINGKKRDDEKLKWLMRQLNIRQKKHSNLPMFLLRQLVVAAPGAADALGKLQHTSYVDPMDSADDVARTYIIKDPRSSLMDFKTITLIDLDEIEIDYNLKDSLEYFEVKGLRKTTFADFLQTK